MFPFLAVYLCSLIWKSVWQACNQGPLFLLWERGWVYVKYTRFLKLIDVSYLLLLSFIIPQDFITSPKSKFILRVHELPLCLVHKNAPKKKQKEFGQQPAILDFRLSNTPCGAVRSLMYKVLLFANEILMCDHSNESYWAVLSYIIHVVLFIMLYKVLLTFKSVDETLMCDHSNESYWAVLSCGTVYYAAQGGSYF